MFKKRRVFNGKNADKNPPPNKVNHDVLNDASGAAAAAPAHDDDNDNDLLDLPVLKKQKAHTLLFKKSTPTARSSTNTNNDISTETINSNELSNDWCNEYSTSSYLHQFDDDEIIMKNKPTIGIQNQIKSDQVDSIMVHRLTPPFLHSASILSSQVQIIDVIKDKSGDLYKYSKNGSAIINEKRKLNDYLKNSKETINEKKRVVDLEKDKSSHYDSNSNSENDNANDDNDDNEFLDNLNSVKDSTQISTRENLPAFKVKNELLNLINENQVIIVIGETGSGKTTQLPQFLYEQGYHKHGMIGITQPRRMAAVSVAKRVSEEMRVKLGNEVGFTIRFNDLTTSLTNIKFMTDGVLLRETLNDSNLDKYSCIIMDEAHERSLNTDILFGIFKKLLMKRRDFKLIITSATMNSLKFSKFFNNAVQFKIPGKTYPVDIMFQSVPSVDYIDSAIKQALKIHLSNPFAAGDNGDILIFMTGQEDIDLSCEILKDELSKLKKINNDILDLDVLPIYSSLSSHLQSKIFRESKNRKCIIATNIAETSLTLNHVKFVIDTGLMKLKVFNPRLNMDSLQIVPISKAQANQRSGRAGRVCPGNSFRLFTLSSYEDEMWDEPIPEIQRSNLMNTILLLKNLNIKNLEKFPFIDKPSSESLETSQYELWSIGALDNFGNLTKIGQKMSQFPIDPTLSKMLIISNFKKFNCCSEILKIIAMLSVPQIFIRPKKDVKLQKKADQIRENFQISDSDHLTLLNIFNQYSNLKEKNPKSLEYWCNRNYFNYKSMKNAIEIHNQLKQLFEKTLKKGEKISACYDNWNVIRECICASYFPNAAEFFKHGQYKHCRSGLEMFLYPTSTLNGVGDLPKYVIFHELLLTGQKQQMNYITSVKPEWLVQYGSVFYSKRIPGISSRENQNLKEEKFNQLIEFERTKN